MLETETAHSSTRYLLTVLGKDPKVASYTIGDQTVAKPLAPLGLIELLPADQQPDRVLALCTEAAKKESWPVLESALGSDVAKRLPVPEGQTREDIDEFLTVATGWLPHGAQVELTVDLTHGFRHFSVLVYVAALYLEALHPNLTVRAVYYGLLNGPFFDLGPLLKLPRWIHALLALDETGNAVPLSDRLAGEDPPIPQIRQCLRQLTETYTSGLPLELGKAAAHFIRQHKRPFRRHLHRDLRIPWADAITDRVLSRLERVALPNSPGGNAWKAGIELGRDELERQARIIDDLLEQEHLATAVRLLDEWTVSWAIWNLYPDQDWLDFRNIRRRAAGALGTIHAFSQDPEMRESLSPEQEALACFWHDLDSVRNAFAHHGMRPTDLLSDTQTKVQRVLAYWRETLRASPRLDLAAAGSTAGPLLITPLGNTPGALYSALLIARDELGQWPESLLVVCSAESKKHLAEAADRAGFLAPLEEAAAEMTDPFSGFDEIEKLVTCHLRRLLGASRVLVNITGGTSLMGLAVERLGAEARKNPMRPVRRFGLIDTRAPEEQRADPYHKGEPLWLDAKE